VPLYYPPLPFYVAAAFSLVAGNTLHAMALSCWLALAVSGLTMYAFSRSLLSGGISFAAAALYMLAPYHLLDLYQGSTVSEFWTFAWVPLLLAAVRRVGAEHSLQGVAYLAFGYALLVLTHVPVAFLTTLTLPIYALLLTRNPRALLRVTAGLALGAGIGAIFLIPVLFETGYVKLFFKFDYRDYFLFERVRAALTSTRFPAESSLFSYSLDSYSVSADTDSVITLRPLYFPGWIARVDGMKRETAPSPDGNTQLHVEPGEHTLTLSFEDTWPRTVGKIVSAVSLLIVLGVLYVARRSVTATR